MSMPDLRLLQVHALLWVVCITSLTSSASVRFEANLTDIFQLSAHQTTQVTENVASWPDVRLQEDRFIRESETDAVCHLFQLQQVHLDCGSSDRPGAQGGATGQGREAHHRHGAKVSWAAEQ